MLHLATKEPSAALWPRAFLKCLEEIGPLTLVSDAGRQTERELLEQIRRHPVLITGWDSMRIPDAILDDPGELKYICHLTGSLSAAVSEQFFESEEISITNWGDSMAFEVAEGALTLLLACLKNLRGQIDEKRTGVWSDNFNGPSLLGGTLRNLRVGLYGFGSTGRHFAELLQPFGAKLFVYDPFVKIFPEYVTRVDSLDDLFSATHAVSVHAGVNEHTYRSVTAKLLSKLPEDGIVINTARGEIIDQVALFEELKNGRLRAGLDVLDDPDEGDHLPSEHPARQWSNLILSAHAISINHWPHPMCSPNSPLRPFHETALDNLRRFISGEPLLHRITKEVFLRMT